MYKYILALLLGSFLAGTMSGCSFGGTEEGASQTEELATEDEFAEAATDEFGDDELLGDDFSEGGEFGDEFADEFAAEAPPADSAGGDLDSIVGDELAQDSVNDEEIIQDEFADNTADAPMDVPTANDFADSEPAGDIVPSDPIADYTVPSDPVMDSFSGETSDVMGEPAQTWVPVKKVASTPFNKAGVLVNAVYIARDGDDMNAISRKIYGSDSRVQELKNINPTLGQNPSVGDKVYYNSPNRPSDDGQLLNFYQDNGIPAETLNLAAGDNIRTASERVLGHPASWKEIWATNPDVESKLIVNRDYSLQYWPSGDAMPSQAMNDGGGLAPPMEDLPPPPEDLPPPPPPVAKNDNIPPPPPEPAMDDLPPPPTEDLPPPPVANNDLPPPPPPADDLPPPPPATAQVEPPPPPPPPVKKPPIKRPKAPSASASVDEDADTQIMTFGLLGFIILLVVIAVVIRRRRAKQQEMDFNTSTHTQIE